MLIEQVQIEDGFLDGLNIQFVPGLNVLIGARGTGKTSLIELIRFALGAPGFTEDAERRGNQQAINVLQGGQVSVVLRDADGRFVVTRSEHDEMPRSSRPIPLVTVLAQSEIEAVGAQASGRLLLIDRFRPDRQEVDQRRLGLISTLRSITAEIGGARDELQSINEQILDMRNVRSQRLDAVAQQRNLLKSIEATESDRRALTELQAHAAVLGVRSAIYERTTSTLRGLMRSLSKSQMGYEESKSGLLALGETTC